MCVFLGFGACGFLAISTVSAQKHFDKHRALAISLSTLGFSIGDSLGAPIIEILKAYYGWHSVCIILSGVSLHTVACGFLFRGLDSHDNPIKQPESDTIPLKEPRDARLADTNGNCSGYGTELNKDPPPNLPCSQDSLNASSRHIVIFTLLICSRVVQSTQFMVMLQLTPTRAKDIGLNDTEISALISTIGISRIISRLLTGAAGDLKWFNKTFYCCVISFAAGLVMCCNVFTSLIPNMVIVGLFGLFTGMCISHQQTQNICITFMQCWSNVEVFRYGVVWELPVKGMVDCQNSRAKGPQNAIVPVGRSRPYSIIIHNMRFIPKASLRASSQIPASSYILERHLCVNNSIESQSPWSWIIAGRRPANKVTVLLGSKWVEPTLVPTPSEHKTFVWLYTMLDQRQRRWADVVQMFYKCLAFAGQEDFLSSIVHFSNVGSIKH